MKKLLLSLFLIVAALNLNATEVTFLTNSTASNWTGDTSGYSTTVDGFTISYVRSSATAAVAPYADHIRVYKGASLTVKSNNGDAITDVVISCVKNYCSDIVVEGETVSANTTSNTITWSGNVSEFVAESNAAQIRVSSITITYGQPAAVFTPKFSLAEGTYYEAQDVALSCATDGAIIYYTIDGADPTISSTVYANPIRVAATTTIKAMATKDGKSSDIALSTYTIAEPIAIDNVANFNTQPKGVVVKFTNPVTVIYQNEQYMFVQDETGALQIFGITGQIYKNGDVIPAGFMGTVDVYSGLIQLAPLAETFKTGVPGSAVEPIVVTSQGVTNALVNKLVKIVGGTLTLDEGKTKNYTMTDDKGTTAVYDRFAGVAIPKDGKKYDVTAIVNLFNTTIQLFPIQFTESGASGLEEIEGGNPVAKIVAGNSVINIDVAENAQVLVVNTVGQMVARKSIAAGSNTIEVPAGFYVVKVNDTIAKVVVK